MTTITADAARRVAIDFLFLDISSCARCQGSDDNLDTALETVEQVMRATGAEVEVRRVQITSLEQARELRFEVSPTIRVNGRDIELEARESACGPDACGCGEGGTCRVWSYRGQEYPEAPVGLIVDSILVALYSPGGDAEPGPHQVPDGVVRALTNAGGGCCG